MMRADYIIRRATLDDLAAIVTHRRRMYEDMGCDDAARLDAQDTAFAAWLRPRLEDGRYLGWLALAPNDEAAASLGVWLLDWPPGPTSLAPYRAYILNVYTEPAHRRQGLARRLVETALVWSRAQGIEVVMLHASDQGRPVYAALGFAPTTEMRLLLVEAAGEEADR